MIFCWAVGLSPLMRILNAVFWPHSPCCTRDRPALMMTVSTASSCRWKLTTIGVGSDPQQVASASYELLSPED